MEKEGISAFRKHLVIFIPIILVVVGLLVYPSDKSETETTKAYEKTDTESETNESLSVETDYISIEDKFYLKVPGNFKRLDDEIIAEKYNGDVPDIVFSNEEVNINIAVSFTENQMADSQIKEYKEYMETLFEYAGEVVGTDYYTVDHHNVGQIKVISEAVDTQIYNNVIFFSYDNKLVLISFNCTEALKDEWGDVGDSIIGSLSFNNE